ncbi:MAG: DJ-1/PfpI family protein [Clostridiales bacterium]|nr:DJ-1/PfpI family protein [Clostridiales bacterium]
MVYILLADGFETAEALCPCDMLRRANVPVQLVGVNGPTARSGQGITVRTDSTLKEVSFDELELLMLPGGLVGVDNILASKDAMALIRRTAAAGKYVAAICAAPTILGRLGLLEGKRAVCYPGMEGGLTGAQPCVGESVVVDGNIVTGEAAGSSIAFGLKLVELLCSPEAERKVHQGIHYHG